MDAWNSFDALIVVGSVLDILLSELSVSWSPSLGHITLNSLIDNQPCIKVLLHRPFENHTLKSLGYCCSCNITLKILYDEPM